MIVSTAGKTVEVKGGNILITEKITKKDKTIPISSVVSVQIQKPGFTGGYLYFQTVGGLNNNRNKIVHNVIKDENSIILNSKEKYETALEIKKYIENYQSEPVVMRSSSDADELIKYKQLLDDGAITQEEFDLKKNQLLHNVSKSEPIKNVQPVVKKGKKNNKRVWFTIIGLFIAIALILPQLGNGLETKNTAGKEALSEEEIKTQALEFDERAWDDYLVMYKNHNDFMAALGNYSDGDISDLDFYDYCKNVEKLSAEASLSFGYGTTKDEKEYLSTFETWALAHQQVAKDLMKYMDSMQTKDLSKAKENVERAQEAAIVIATNRAVLLKKIGLTEDEINKRIDEGIAKIEALDKE